MSDTLRDQLLGLGFKPVAKPEQPRPPRRDAPQRDVSRRDARKRGEPGRDARAVQSAPAPGTPERGRRDGRTGPLPKARPPRLREDIDLAKAYAIRAQREKDERIEAERRKQEDARKRREAKAALALLVAGKGLNDAAADIARHFEYGGKIKRVHVTAEQLRALNAGELGVLQLDGRYVVVDADLLAQAEAVFAPAVALKVDPAAPASDDPYADPKYQVPDDLVW